MSSALNAGNIAKYPYGIANRSVSQTRVPLADCRELALDYNTLPKPLYVFEHKT